MTILWPATLPPRPGLIAGDESQDGRLRADPKEGAAIARQRFSATVRKITTSVLFTGAERRAFDSFFITTLKEGTLRFQWVDPVTDAPVMYRFVRPPAWAALRGDPDPAKRLWQASFELEILPGAYAIHIPGVQHAAISLAGEGILAATGHRITHAAAALAGEGVLVAAGHRIRHGAIALSGEGTLAAAGTVVPAAPALEFAQVADPAEQNFNGNPRTYSGLSFGDAATGRVLYGVHLASCGQGSDMTLTGATLDGAAMTVVASQHVRVSTSIVFIHIVKIAQADMATPSATSGDVVFTFVSGNCNGSKFQLFRGVGYSDTAHDTLEVPDTTPNSGTIDFPSNGLFFGGVMDYGGSGGYTWSPTVTEGFDDGMRFAGRGSIAYADGITGGAGTTVTATVDSGGGTPCALVAATFAPT